jgi:hypothetical protein
VIGRGGDAALGGAARRLHARERVQFAAVRNRVVIALAVLAALVAGCAGSGGGGSSSGSSSGGSSSGSASTGVQTAADTRAYLKAMEPIRRELTGALEGLGQLGGLSSKPDESWALALQALHQSIGALDIASTRLAAVGAPRDLEAAHEGYRVAVERARSLLRTLARDLTQGDVAAVAAWPTTVPPVVQGILGPLAKWRTSVVQAARAEGVPVPGWVRRTGS